MNDDATNCASICVNRWLTSRKLTRRCMMRSFPGLPNLPGLSNAGRAKRKPRLLQAVVEEPSSGWLDGFERGSTTMARLGGSAGEHRVLVHEANLVTEGILRVKRALAPRSRFDLVVDALAAREFATPECGV